MTAPKLVIGANGFLGSHVTRQLVESGAEVRAMVRRTSIAHLCMDPPNVAKQVDSDLIHRTC